MKIVINETLAAEARRARFLADGTEPPHSHRIEIDARDLTAEAREALLSCVLADYSGKIREHGDESAGASPIAVGTTQTVFFRSVEVHEYGRTEGLERRIFAAAAYAPEARAEHESREAERGAADEASRAKLLAEREAREAAAQVAKAAREAQVAEWVRDHGSERLKLAVEMVGTSQCRGIYRDERLAQLCERSGLTWEYDLDRSDHKDALNPSIGVLRLCQRVREHATSWDLDTDEGALPRLVFVENGGTYTNEIAVMAFLDDERVLVAPR